MKMCARGAGTSWVVFVFSPLAHGWAGEAGLGSAEIVADEMKLSWTFDNRVALLS